MGNAEILPYPWSLLCHRLQKQRPALGCATAPASIGIIRISPRTGVNQEDGLVRRCEGGELFEQEIPLSANNPVDSGDGVPRLGAAFPRPKGGAPEQHGSGRDDAPEHFLALVDLLASWRDEALSLCDEAKAGEGDLRRYARQPYLRIPWERLLQRWSRSDPGLDPAPLSLVARIARDHGEQLLGLAAAPRRLLVRRREEERIDRVQELDPQCLLDFAQRPGRTIAEKAGRGQTLLGVVRRETVDTLENRVLKDVLALASRRARVYASENAEAAARGSRRIRRAEIFRRSIDGLLRHSQIATAARLDGDVQPNYALLKDPRYQIVWRCWQDLRREEKMRKELWRWSRRMWADVVRAWIVAGLHTTAASSGYTPAGERDAYLRRDHDRGRLFLADSQSTRFRNREEGRLLDLIHPDHFADYPERELSRLLVASGADFALVRFSPQEGIVDKHRSIFVYTTMPLSEELELPRVNLAKELENLRDLLRKRCRLLVVVGTSGAAETRWSDDGRLCLAWVQPASMPGMSCLSTLTLELMNGTHDPKVKAP